MTKAQLWNLKKNKRNIHQKVLIDRDKEVKQLRDYIKAQDETIKNIQKDRDFYFNSNYDRGVALIKIKRELDNLSVFNISNPKKEILEIIEKALSL